jgi:hypothetical protein
MNNASDKRQDDRNDKIAEDEVPIFSAARPTLKDNVLFKSFNIIVHEESVAANSLFNYAIMNIAIS